MSALQNAKWWLVHHAHLAKDALHIYVALALFFGSMLLFGWKPASWRPWLLVLAVALIGEAWDIRDRLVVFHLAQDFGGNLHDIWNTLFWPSVILLLARRTTIFARGR